MKVLLIGGSGYVGSLIIPYLAKQHSLRVLDRDPPRDASMEFIQGSVTDESVLDRAFAGVDTFITLLMQGGRQGGLSTEQNHELIRLNHEVNCLGLHQLLHKAADLGIRRGVHTSTVTVHWRGREYFHGENLIPLDSPSPYGLTKALGEEVCRYFCRWFDMNILALRLSGPRSDEEYRQEMKEPGPARLKVVHEEDLAAAYLKALDLVQRGHGAFDVVYVSGDRAHREWNMTRADWLLDWQPRP
jgi:nucleoside-diphosphate-sugar epimerase